MAYGQVPVPIQFQVSPPFNPSTPDGTLMNLAGGRQGDLYVDELYGRHYHQTYRGRLFHGATAAAGVLIPVSNTTGPTFGIWNPAGNTYNAVLIAAYYGWVSTTGAPANIGYAALTGAGSSIATAAPVSAFTAGTPKNGLLGSGQASTVLFTPSTATLTTAGGLIGTNGMSQLTTTGATTSAPLFTCAEWFDGTIIIPPGVFVYPISSNTAELSVMDIRWVWAEVPV